MALTYYYFKYLRGFLTTPLTLPTCAVRIRKELGRTNMKLLIGLVGKKGSGKSTVALYMINRGGSYVEFAFADPLKEILEIIFKLNYHQLHGNAKELPIDELGVSPRQLMQKIGSDLFRDKLLQCIPELNLQGKTIWLWHMEKRIQDSLENHIIVSDIRFEDEMKLIKGLGGIIVKINNPMDQLSPSLRGSDIHISEMLDVTEVDYIIDNCGTMQHLQEQVDALEKYVGISRTK